MAETTFILQIRIGATHKWRACPSRKYAKDWLRKHEYAVGICLFKIKKKTGRRKINYPGRRDEPEREPIEYVNHPRGFRVMGSVDRREDSGEQVAGSELGEADATAYQIAKDYSVAGWKGVNS